MPSAPGAASVRVWQVMSRGRDPSTVTGPRQGRPPPESVHVAYPLDTQYAPPRDELERWLADLWASVLDLDSVGIDDQFLDLGGDSLAAMRIASQVLATWSLELSLAVILEAATVAQMAAAVRDRLAQPRT